MVARVAVTEVWSLLVRRYLLLVAELRGCSLLRCCFLGGFLSLVYSFCNPLANLYLSTRYKLVPPGSYSIILLHHCVTIIVISVHFLFLVLRF